MIQSFKSLSISEQGGSIVEYTFILGLVALAAVTALQTMGVSINDKFSSFNKL